METSYRHTQYNNWIVIALGIVLLFSVWMIFTLGWQISLMLLMLPVVVGLVIFHALTVQVDNHQVRLHFGLGWPQAAFPLENVDNVRVVDDTSLSGWGIRFTSYGVLYRIAGLDAVELGLADGRRVRIGTDEPEALAKAIEDALIANRAKRKH